MSGTDGARCYGSPAGAPPSLPPGPGDRQERRRCTACSGAIEVAEPVGGPDCRPVGEQGPAPRVGEVGGIPVAGDARRARTTKHSQPFVDQSRSATARSSRSSRGWVQRPASAPVGVIRPTRNCDLAVGAGARGRRGQLDPVNGLSWLWCAGTTQNVVESNALMCHECATNVPEASAWETFSG